MSQQQITAALILLAGPPTSAISTGNNATWHCPCGRPDGLIGRSGLLAGVTPGYRVDCPAPA
jgi:hypothetical protein